MGTVDIDITITKAVTKFVNDFIENDPNNYLIISNGENSISVGLLLKREDDLLISELYTCVDGVVKIENKKTNVDSILYSVLEYQKIRDKFVNRMCEIVKRTIIALLENKNVLVGKDDTETYTKINVKFTQMYGNKRKTKIPNKYLSDNCKSLKELPNFVADLIKNNDNVQISFLTNNSYLEKNIIINLYLEKRMSASGIEVVHISETRTYDDKNVLLNEDSFDDIYAASSTCNIKDSMKDEEFKKVMLYVIEDSISHIIIFMDKIGDKGSKKYKIYTF